MDERSKQPCCRFAQPIELETEPELFNCETCRVAGALRSLWPENLEAWILFQRVTTRFVYEHGLGHWIIAGALADASDDERDELLTRMAIIQDLFTPVTIHGA